MKDDTGGMEGMDLMDIDEMESLVSQEETSEKPEAPAESNTPSIAEVMSQVNRLENALKVSEEARMQAQKQALQPNQPEEETPLTDEELGQLMQTDSVAAVKYMQDRALKEAERHLERRLQGLSVGSMVAGRNAAATKYATEFKLFEKEIDNAINMLNPQARESLADPNNWDQLIGYIRGQPGNFEKYLQHHTQQSPEIARHNAELNSGYSATTRRVQPASADAVGLDDIQLKIAEELGITPQDYKKWSRR